MIKVSDEVVLRCILCYCNLQDVVALLMTNTHFYNIVLCHEDSRSLWKCTNITELYMSITEHLYIASSPHMFFTVRHFWNATFTQLRTIVVDQHAIDTRDYNLLYHISACKNL